MNTIKIYLAESGRVADLKKDFPLYQGQYQNKLLNVFVPTSILAPSFVTENSDGVVLADYVASTAVKIGMTYVARDGSIKVSKNYYMRYLKTLTYQGVEYALYERKLPQEFTLYAGQGQNAPVLIANVVNIQNDVEPPIILSLTTSQSCSLDVMPSSNLDSDETIDPTELEEINGRLNAIDEALAKKQNITDDALNTTDKTVVGAINEIKASNDEQNTQIETNTQDIATNRNDIDYILENFASGEDYIGQMTGATLPTDEQLDQFVENNTNPSRQSKNGDVIIFILQIEGATDENYKYYKTSSGWKGYIIPALETSKNGTLGIIEGTYSIGFDNPTLVNISGGRILNIYIKDATGTYRDIQEYANSLNATIQSIISGNTSVGLAVKALQDGLGRNIVDTYITQNAGATKQYVRDYSLPRIFNDIDFIASDGYQPTVPTEPETGIQFSAETSAVGDFTLFQILKTISADFELSSKNSSQNTIFVSANQDTSVYFRLSTQAKKQGEDWVDLAIELSNLISLNNGEIYKLEFNSAFTYLNENVITLTNGDLIRQTLEVITQESTPTTFSVYSNETYPSSFAMNVLSQRIYTTAGNLGELPLIEADGVLVNDTITFVLPSNLQLYNNVFARFVLTYPESTPIPENIPIQLALLGETIRLVTPYNFVSGSATMNMLKQVNTTFNSATGTVLDFNGLIVVSGTDIQVVVNEDNLQEMNDTLSQKANTEDLENGTTVVKQAENAQNFVTGGTIDQALEQLTTQIANIIKGDYLSSGVNITLTKKEGGVTIDIESQFANSLVRTVPQSLTDEEKAQARSNIGVGSSGFDGTYDNLIGKPNLNTNNTDSLSVGTEEINGTINLHKVSKTGSFQDLNNIPTASESVSGLIQIATDEEAEQGTDTQKAINSKQLSTAIKGLGTVFNLKGSVQTIEDLPTTGNSIGDVWYVQSESVGYIWLNDGATERWEQLGIAIDLSGYVQFIDVVNNLTSSAVNKPLSAYQGSVLKGLIDTINTTLTSYGSRLTALEQTTQTLENDVSELGNELNTTNANLNSEISTRQSETSNLSSQITTLNNSALKTSGDQTASGTKTFTGTIIVPDVTIE